VLICGSGTQRKFDVTNIFVVIWHMFSLPGLKVNGTMLTSDSPYLKWLCSVINCWHISHYNLLFIKVTDDVSMHCFRLIIKKYIYIYIYIYISHFCVTDVATCSHFLVRVFDILGFKSHTDLVWHTNLLITFYQIVNVFISWLI